MEIAIIALVFVLLVLLIVKSVTKKDYRDSKGGGSNSPSNRNTKIPK